MEHFQESINNSSLRWNILFSKCEDAPLKVWQQPQRGIEYSVGVDTSTGLGEDYSVAQVLTRTHPYEQVASFRAKWSVVDIALFVAMLGHWYNTAFMTVETNFPGNAIQDALVQQYQYPRNYKQEQHLSEKQTISTNYGFTTTQASKWLLIREMQSLMAGKDIILRDEVTIEELGNFIYIEDKTKTGAATGFNDDCVMALMLAAHTAMMYPQVSTVKLSKESDPHKKKIRRQINELIEKIMNKAQNKNLEIL